MLLFEMQSLLSVAENVPSLFEIRIPLPKKAESQRHLQFQGKLFSFIWIFNKDLSNVYLPYIPRNCEDFILLAKNVSVILSHWKPYTTHFEILIILNTFNLFVTKILQSEFRFLKSRFKNLFKIYMHTLNRKDGCWMLRKL